MSNAFEVISDTGAAGLDAALFRQNQLCKEVVFSSGGTIKNLLLGMTFGLFVREEDFEKNKLNMVSEPITIMLNYDDMGIKPIMYDADGRIGEVSYFVTKRLLESITNALSEWKEKLEVDSNGA